MRAELEMHRDRPIDDGRPVIVLHTDSDAHVAVVKWLTDAGFHIDDCEAVSVIRVFASKEPTHDD